MSSSKEFKAFALSFWVVPALSFLALSIVLYRACYDYAVVSWESPNLLLALFSSFPYFLTFAFSFFTKNATHRKSFYAVLGLLAFMTGFEWMGPKTPEMKNIYSIVWFFQTIFIVPFLVYSANEIDVPKKSSSSAS